MMPYVVGWVVGFVSLPVVMLMITAVDMLLRPDREGRMLDHKRSGADPGAWGR